MSAASLPFGGGAVMASRASDLDSLDYFPTPPWATRAAIPFFESVDPGFRKRTVREPACGEGHMAEPLRQAGCAVLATDIADLGYGHGGVDFLAPPIARAADWVITNPPFNAAKDFVEVGLECAEVGVAMLVRTAWLEGGERYRGLFSVRIPRLVLQYAERVPMVERRWDPTASTATSYAWVMWNHDWARPRPEFDWIPPGQAKALTLASDLEQLAPPRAAWGAQRYDPAHPPKAPASWWRFPARGEGLGWIGRPGEPGWRDDFTHWAPARAEALL